MTSSHTLTSQAKRTRIATHGKSKEIRMLIFASKKKKKNAGSKRGIEERKRRALWRSGIFRSEHVSMWAGKGERGWGRSENTLPFHVLMFSERLNGKSAKRLGGRRVECVETSKWEIICSFVNVSEVVNGKIRDWERDGWSVWKGASVE